MKIVPPDQRSSWKDLIVFMAKAVSMLAGIFAFGFLVFVLRRSIH